MDLPTGIILAAAAIVVIGYVALLLDIYGWEWKGTKNTRARLRRLFLSLFLWHLPNLWWHLQSLWWHRRWSPSGNPSPSSASMPTGNPWASYVVAPGATLIMHDHNGALLWQYHNPTPWYQTLRVDLTTNQISVVTPQQGPPPPGSAAHQQQMQAALSEHILRKTPKDVREVNHPILSYRAFSLRYTRRAWDVMGRVIPIDPVLGPINLGFGDWHPGVNEAHHANATSNHPNEACPIAGGHCGFWSLDNLGTAAHRQVWPNNNEWIPAVAVIQGWGKFQRHTDGYRFQYASVVAMAPGDPTPGITGVAYDFGVNAVREMARQFDTIFVEDWKQLEKIKLDEEAKYAAP
jgi:hypothetical protein